MYKGYDAANITFEETDNKRVINHDEIRPYIETRYVSPVEACYRILSKPLQNRSYSIIRLFLHLPDDINYEIAVEAALNRMNTILAYF